MAKVTFAPDIQSISGKLTSKDNVCYGVNKKTGKAYRYDYTEREDKNTAKQQTVRTTFATKAATAKAWWTTNKPASDDATPTAEWSAMLEAYNSQTKYGNKWVFVRSKLKNADSISFTGSASSGSTTPAGGSTVEGA